MLQEYLEEDGVVFVPCSMKCNELNLSCCSKQLQRCSLTFFREHSRSVTVSEKGVTSCQHQVLCSVTVPRSWDCAFCCGAEHAFRRQRSLFLVLGSGPGIDSSANRLYDKIFGRKELYFLLYCFSFCKSIYEYKGIYKE